MRRLPLILVVAAMLAGCTGERDPAVVETTGAGSKPSAASDAAPAPATPVEATPEASAAGEPRPPTVTPTPGANPAAAGDLDQASYTGYGDLPFGTPVGDMPRLWGGELSVNGKEFNDQCYFMTPVWVKQPAEFNFMVSEGRFARFSTESTRFVAPGGGRVGMSTAEVKRLYPGRIEARPHHYTDGQYLRVTDPAGGKGVLVFETDGKGDDARVTEWRIGLPPAVDYVEGCA